MTNVSAVEKMAELMQQMEENSPRVAALQYCLTQLEAKCAALAAENAGLNKFIKADCWVWDDKSEEYIDAVDCIPETPATDAFLAEVRAQGVEMFAKEMHADISGDDAREFAAQLRKGSATEEKQSFLSDEDCHAFVKAFTKGATQ